MKKLFLIMMMLAATLAHAQTGVNSYYTSGSTTTSASFGVNAGASVNTGATACGTSTACVTPAPVACTTPVVTSGCGTTYTGGMVHSSDTRVIFRTHPSGKFKWRLVQQRVYVPASCSHYRPSYGCCAGTWEWRTISRRKVPVSCCR